jgi:DnaK suppressor protein
MAVRISKNYVPNDKEKYMCAKHKEFFKKKLSEWKDEIIKSNNKALYLKEADENISSPDIIDQATSQTEKSVELRTINRQRKLVSKINSALEKIKNDTYGFCEETGEPIGLKRLIARPIATLTIEAQEKHEKNEKIYIED